VWLGWATPAGVVTELQHFAGDRAQVRAATVQHALQRLVTLLQANTP
jgi:nicotinamide-nucleotide amidase